MNTVTLALDILLDEILDCSEQSKIRNITAKVIQEADPEERYVHIEFPDDDNMLDCPHVWRIADWNVRWESHQKKKAKAEARRQAKFLFDARVKIVSARLSAEAGFEDDELFTGMATDIVKNEMPVEWLSINLEEIEA